MYLGHLKIGVCLYFGSIYFQPWNVALIPWYEYFHTPIFLNTNHNKHIYPDHWDPKPHSAPSVALLQSPMNQNKNTACFGFKSI